MIMKEIIKRALNLRRKQKRRKPSFQRQEGYRLKKLKSKKGKEGVWRKPRGRHSKLRQREKARGRLPKKGYGSPKAARSLTRSGLKPITISTPKQVEARITHPKKEAIIISASVGKAKRAKIIEEAKKLGVKVLNA